ncbi:hypothetical protein FE249_16775 [Acidiphilium multivorum]|uniref:hypothetical protein n=1 Tax=Acidiphilium multivorum TaxID=62140 RepID=UPI001F4C4C1F|nr:hypothetical protein [Acidiphilium multivorum]UNC15759.1 hypothetical protein FE249_16775 [Acidiphilium multivorum]
MTTTTLTSPGFLLRPRFDAFIEALCAHIAGEGLKHRVAGPLIILIWQRLRRKRCWTGIVVVTQTGPDVCGHERRRHF